ncbi:MAG: tRNA lysidine(34) synthetase TilS [Bacteroidota bacterium]|nr:tRNA lysidine(34) synthetase TilS [Bacteroidota bacterium]
MSLLLRFKDNVKEQNLFSSKDKLLLAVSGGVDSVVLCELCKQAGYDFTIAHCNFQLRGEESERDEQFVKTLGKKYGTKVWIKKFNTENYAAQNKISIQEAARDLRYAWFDELIKSQLIIANGQSAGDATHHSPLTIHLLTAHHADDNAETILMNFCRGTGLHGLTGIPVSAGHIRRPLLIFSKQELVDFARENKLDYVEDSSNLSSKYTRNLFRNEIIPAISKVYPQLKENLRDNINRFQEIERLYQLSVGAIKKKLCKQKGKEIHIPVKQLLAFQNRALIYEIIAGYGFSDKQVDEVIKLAESDSGKYIESPGHDFRIIKHRHWFIISPVASMESEIIIIEDGISNLEFGMGHFSMEVVPNSPSLISHFTNTACFDHQEIQFPLLLRKWKAGDYFYPLGMRKKKKLARFFIDQKLSKTEKEKVWVLEMNKKIIWVVGHRIDDRFKITGKTKNVLKISLNA